MRLAIAISGPYLANGICRVAVSWARILVAGGHEPTLVFEQGEQPPELPGCQHVTYPGEPGAGRLGRVTGRARRAVRALQALDARASLDLVISHDSAISSGLRRALPAARILQTIHSPVVDENRLNNWKYTRSAVRRATYPLTLAGAWWIEHQALRAIDCAHTLSEYTWSRIRARYPRVAAGLRWEKIPGTFDEQRFRPAENRARVRQELGLDPAARILLSVRRLVPRNGVERILACARRLRERNLPAVFLIGGTGPLEAELRQAITRDGLGEQVALLGFVAEEALPAYYQAADAFLLPTRDLECFGLPVVEAMACGTTPLVVPDGGPPELVSDPACVAASNSTEAFTELVERFAAGEIPVRPQALAREARERFAEAAIRPAVLELVASLGS